MTGGQNLKGFEDLIRQITVDNGLPKAEIMVGAQLVTLPGFFRPTKRWDVLVMNGNRLVAAFEFKSQVGSFGNNFNNRTEEAVGSAHCLLTAAKRGALGPELNPPFLGWLMLVEDSSESTKVRPVAETDFQTFPEFQKTSYIDRYDLFCQKLMSENLYDVAAVISTPEARGLVNGCFTDVAHVRAASVAQTANSGLVLESSLGLRHFVSAFAGRIAWEAAMHPNAPARPPRPSERKTAEKEAKKIAAAVKRAERAFTVPKTVTLNES